MLYPRFQPIYEIHCQFLTIFGQKLTRMSSVMFPQGRDAPPKHTGMSSIDTIQRFEHSNTYALPQISTDLRNTCSVCRNFWTKIDIAQAMIWVTWFFFQHQDPPESPSAPKPNLDPGWTRSLLKTKSIKMSMGLLHNHTFTGLAGF